MSILKELRIVVANTKDGRTVVLDGIGQIVFEINLETVRDCCLWEVYKPPIFWFI